MPYLSIIPAAAVADGRLTDTHIRVLCAIGTHTNKLGGNVWASVATLAKESNVSERTVQRSILALVECGYITRTERMGRTNLYEVSLQSSPPVTAVTPPPSAVSPKRVKERYTLTEEDILALKFIWTAFPARDVANPYVPFLEAYKALRLQGKDIDSICQAADAYASAVVKAGTEPKFVKTPHRFYADGTWESYVVSMVEGRTREEWARSGQDVAEFDRMVGAT